MHHQDGRSVLASRPTVRRAQSLRRRSVTVAAVLLVAVAALLRAFVIQPYVVPSGSMQPTLAPGDRVLVRALDDEQEVHRGDTIVFSAPRWRAADTVDDVYVKRVIAIGGDRIRCCTADRRLELNGEPLPEPYLASNESPSAVTFDVVVPAGRLWVMGDNRSGSADSRAHLGPDGDPVPATVPLDAVRGRVLGVFWPPAHAG